LKKRIVPTLKYLLLLLVGFGLLWLTFRNEDLSEIVQKMSMADPFWLGLSVIIAFLAFVSRAVRWIMLMEPLGYKPKLKNTLYALFLGYFANLAIPRIGEITRCGTLTSLEKVPFNSLIGTVIVERVIDVLMLLFTMMLVAILEFEMLSNFLMEKIIRPLSGNVDIPASGWIIGFLAISTLLLVLFIRWIRGPVTGENTLKYKVKGMIREIASGLKSILRMKKNGWFLFHTFFMWFLYFLLTWVCFFCLESTSHLDVKAGMFILVVGGLGMSAPVQGGIGAYHYIVSQGLQLFNVSSTDGIAYATLVHTTQTLIVVILGLYAVLMVFLIKRKTAGNG
jgi:glycosyltransferase 2 family protein